MDMTGEALSGMRFESEGDTLGLWCDREPGTGVWVTAVRSGLTGPGLAGKIQEHEQGHRCSPEDGEPSTVTVVTDDGETETWNADGLEFGDDGELYVGRGEKDGLAETYGVYAKRRWCRAEIGGHRVPSGPDHSARAAGLEAGLQVVLKIAGNAVVPEEALKAIATRASRALGLPEGSASA